MLNNWKRKLQGLQKLIFDKRTALNRKSEGDPSDSDMEDSALAKLWHKESAPNDDVDLLMFRHRDHYVASVHQTGTEKPMSEELKTPFPCDECGWDYIDDTSG